MNHIEWVAVVYAVVAIIYFLIKLVSLDALDCRSPVIMDILVSSIFWPIVFGWHFVKSMVRLVFMAIVELLP